MLLGCVRAGSVPQQDASDLFLRLGTALASGGVPPPSRPRVALLLAALGARGGASAIEMLIDTALQLGDSDEAAAVELALALLTATAEEALLRGRGRSDEVDALLQARALRWQRAMSPQPGATSSQALSPHPPRAAAAPPAGALRRRGLVLRRGGGGGGLRGRRLRLPGALGACGHHAQRAHPRAADRAAGCRAGRRRRRGRRR